MSDENSQPELDLKRVRQHVDQLGEFFDTVQIFVSRHDPATADGTVTVHLGSGNWYARYGQVAEWMIMHDEETRRSRQTSE